MVKQLLEGDDVSFDGLLTLLEKELATSTQEKRRDELESYRAELRCEACEGSRLRVEARQVKLAGRSIHQITQLPLDLARTFLSQIEIAEDKQAVATPLVAEIVRRLQFLEEVGVHYLSLDRSADTLSGGELQRVRLATSIGSGLVGVCYILDEPSIGLHPRDNERLIRSLRDLQLQGNTVLVVEHDKAMMRAADHLIDVGPVSYTHLTLPTKA